MNKKKKEHLFNRKNYIIVLVGSILILIGFILMSGSGSNLTDFNPDIFSNVRIRLAPLLCVAGYLINIIGIMSFPNSQVCKH